ncbi:hypothetical protein PULV_b0378 [Pseudoalteromonas ulvae UL12]|nr:hypothetical protein [Pseudoalteromonas ulvae UL12]
MNLATQAKSAQVLMKAFSNACEHLKVSNTEKCAIIGVNPSTLSRNQQKGFAPQSKTGELQLQFIRLYRSLYAISGGDSAFMQHWFRSNNKALNAIPSHYVCSIVGLINTNEYLDAMRGKI